MSKPHSSYNSSNHDLFENVQDLRRKLQETERTLYTLNIQERAVEGSHPTTSAPNPTRVPPLRLEDITGDDSVEIQNILGAGSHRSDGSSPRPAKGTQKSKGDRPLTYGSTQQKPYPLSSKQHQYHTESHPARVGRRTTTNEGASHLVSKSQNSSAHPQGGKYVSPGASTRGVVSQDRIRLQPNVDGYHGNAPVSTDNKQRRDRGHQLRSHDGTEESHDLHLRQDVQSKRPPVTDLRDDGGQFGYTGHRNYDRGGQGRSSSTLDLYHSNGGAGSGLQGLDSARAELADGRSRSFQNLSQRTGVSGVSDIQQDKSISSESNFDVTSLRHKIHDLREENAKLVSQNHKLLNQLEDLGFERKRAVEEIETIKAEVKKQGKRSEELQEQLICHQSGSDAQEKALRESEDRCEDYQRDMGELESLLTEYKSQVSTLEEQISDQENLLKRYESERNKSLDTAEEIQRAYEEHQKRAKEKLKKFEVSEEHYKEKLKYVDEQREQMIVEIEAYKSQLRDISEQVRSVHEDGRIEKESRYEAEQHNLQLRSQVALLQQKCAQLEQTQRLQEGLQQENESLKVTVSEYKVRLEKCQVQIGESQAELLRLEELATSLRDIPGKKTADKDLNGSYLETLETENLEVMIAELRCELELRDQEVQRLQSVVSSRSRSEGGHTDTQEAVRRELRVATDKNKQAEQRVEELETLLLRLEEERATFLKKLATQEEKLSDFKISSDSLDTKLTHRNSQVVELQKEMDEKLQEMNRLEREIRKKASQISSLERQLDSKVTEVSDQVTRVSDLEEELQAKSVHLQQLKTSLEEKTGELVQSNSMAQKLKSIHVEQCKELEKQIELLERKFQEKESFMKEQGNTIEGLRRELLMKDTTLNESVRKARLDIERKCVESDMALQAFERKSHEATGRVKQLESALVVCKEELNVYVEQYQDTKLRHELELADWEAKVGNLEHQLATSKELLSEKEQQIVELETSLKGRLEMVEQSAARIGELEDGQGNIEKQMSSLEQQLHTERSRLESERLSMETEVKAMESKLQQACVEVESKNMEIQELVNTVSDLELERQAVSEEVSELERQLGQEKTDSDSRLSQLEEVHREVRQLRGQVKDREEKLDDLSESLKRHKQDINEKSAEITRDKAEIRQLKTEHQMLSNRYAESQLEVDSVNLELGDKSRILEEHRLTIRRKEDDLRSKAREMETLERALEERNWELQQRAAQLTQIDMEVRGHKTDMDQRHVRLEGQLKQYQLESQQKNKQLADIDDRLREAQEEVREKSLQLQQSEQSNRKLKLEVESHAAQAQDTEMQVYTLRHRLESSLTENTELGQELTTAREEIQKIHYELTESRREFSVNKRELEKLHRENQEARQKLQENEEYIKTLNEQLGQTKARGEKLETQTDVETRKLVIEVDAMRNRHLTEIKSLTTKLTAQSVAETGKDAQIEEMQLKQTQLLTQVEDAKKQSGHFEGQLKSCQRLIEQLQSTVETKNTELARMKGRLVGYENCVTSQPTPHMTTSLLNPQPLPPTQSLPAHTGYQSTIDHHPLVGYQSTDRSDTLDSLGHLGNTGDTRSGATYIESNQGGSLTGHVLTNQNQPHMPQQVAGTLPSSAHSGQQFTLVPGNERSNLGVQPVVGSEPPSQDDSIMSLLNRMQMHERNVQDMLDGRLSTGEDQRLPHGGGVLGSITGNLGGANASVHHAVKGANTAFNQAVGGAMVPISEAMGRGYAGIHQAVDGANITVSHPVGGAMAAVNQSENRSGSLLKGSEAPASSLEVDGLCCHSEISSGASSSGRGTLVASDPGTVNPDHLADYLASDPESFQAMFKKLRDSYTTSIGSNTLENLHRPALEGSLNDAPQYLLSSQKQLIPTKDDHHSQGAIPPQYEHPGYKPLSYGPDISILSSISESESLKSAMTKKGKGVSNLASQQYTSSPKANRNTTKKSVRIAAPAQNKGGLTKFNSKNPSGTKISKKSGANGSSATSKKPAKAGQSGSAPVTQKPSRFGALVAKGLANIEAAAHPNKKVPKSPGESEPSPNVSTAISHYAADVDQSHGGSFLDTDQSVGDNITLQSGSSGEERYMK